MDIYNIIYIETLHVSRQQHGNLDKKLYKINTRIWGGSNNPKKYNEWWVIGKVSKQGWYTIHIQCTINQIIMMMVRSRLNKR